MISALGSDSAVNLRFWALVWERLYSQVPVAGLDFVNSTIAVYAMVDWVASSDADFA